MIDKDRDSKRRIPGSHSYSWPPDRTPFFVSMHL